MVSTRSNSLPDVRRSGAIKKPEGRKGSKTIPPRPGKASPPRKESIACRRNSTDFASPNVPEGILKFKKAFAENWVSQLENVQAELEKAVGLRLFENDKRFKDALWHIRATLAQVRKIATDGY